jgi:hypothetical protein
LNIRVIWRREMNLHSSRFLVSPEEHASNSMQQPKMDKISLHSNKGIVSHSTQNL